MTLDGQRARGFFGLGRPGLAVLGCLAAGAGSARAQEPLFLRIRPPPEPGSAQAGRAAREALWARRQAHARVVIESVCTGCLAPWAPPDAPPIPTPAGMATLTAPKGLETDPGSGASGPTSEPPTPERRP